MKYSIRITSLLFILFVGLNSVKSQFLNEQGLKFIKLFNWLESYYVDSFNLEKYSDNVIRDMLHKLDPHSAYLTKDEVNETNEQLQGNFEGVGITFNVLDDTIIVVATIADGPSAKVGVKAGDRIIEIDNKIVAGIGITNRDVVSKLRGKKGTTVSIKVYRKGLDSLLEFSIIRDKISINSVDAHYKVDHNTGYVRLSRFSITTMKEVTDLLSQFTDEKVHNLILDLSGNGGGYLDVAVSLADVFIGADKLLVFTKGNHSEKKEYFSTPNGLFEKGKLVIIIDENSASASEIVAGAIQDWDRGIIVGRRSFGKGLVQRPFNFPDGSMIRLTVARYYTPSGRLIQKSYSEGFEAYSKELHKRLENGELLDKSNTQLADSFKYYTLMRKRIVYGGGGITPDVFVPLDTAGNSDYFKKLVGKGILSGFSLNYVDRNRYILSKQYPVFKDFITKFRVDDNILKEFINYADGKSIIFKREEFEISKDKIALFLKANIASDIWGTSEFYEILNSEDPSFNRALEIINNWDKYLSLITPQ